MNPADVEFPDPMDAAQPDSPISNDELLSQLAGKEIERLLAEVDEQLDAAMGLVGAAHDPSPTLALRRYPQTEVRNQAAALEDVFRKVSRDHANDVAGDVGETALSDEETVAMRVVGTPVEEFERVTQAENRAPRRVSLFDEIEEKPPLYIRGLEFLNAPFQGLSDAALGAIGKIAIASFVSAAAALGYVIVLLRS